MHGATNVSLDTQFVSGANVTVAASMDSRTMNRIQQLCHWTFFCIDQRAKTQVELCWLSMERARPDDVKGSFNRGKNVCQALGDLSSAYQSFDVPVEHTVLNCTIG